MKILVIAEMNSSNIGDQAIFAGLKKYLISKKISVFPLDLSCSKKALYSGIVEDKELNISFKSSMRKYKLVYIPLNVIRRVLVHVKNLKTWIATFRENDLIIVGGGSLLINNSYSFPISLFFVKLCAKFTNTEYYVLGCSMSSKYNFLSRYMLYSFLNSAEKIYLRDSLSVKYLKNIFNLEAVLSSDLALLLDQDIKRERDSNIVAINMIEFSGHDMLELQQFQKHYYETIEALIELLLEKGIKVNLFTTGGEGDYQNGINFRETISNQVDIFHPKTLDTLLDYLCHCNGVISTRLHAAILSFVTLTPFVGITWDNKVNGFLNDIHMSENCFSVEDNAIDIMDQLMNAMQNKDMVTQSEKQKQKYLLITHINEIIDTK